MTSSPRVHVGKQDPEVYKALQALSKSADQAAEAAGLDVLLLELVKIRASQINGCAFCLHVHVAAAIKNGETQERLALLPAWQETGYFSEVERAALSLAESITEVSLTRVDDQTYDEARTVLTDAQISAVVWVTTAINSFNRVAISSRYEVAPSK